MTVIHWIGEHSNKVRMAIWQILLLSVAMKWITLEEAQLAAWGMAIDAVLGVIVETNTVSKVRVGERITEEVTKRTGVFTPPIVLVPFLIGALLVSACASNPKQRITLTYQSVELGLGAVQDAERAAFAAGAIPKDVHERTISPAFIKAFDAQITFGHALLVWKPGVQPPQTYEAWLATITNTVDVLKEVTPKNRPLLDAVVAWVRQAVAIIKEFKQDVPPQLAAIATP